MPYNGQAGTVNTEQSGGSNVKFIKTYIKRHKKSKSYNPAAGFVNCISGGFFVSEQLMSPAISLITGPHLLIGPAFTTQF